MYPLPENMGFPIRQTISEMLPDEPLVEPESQRGRYGKNIHVSLNEYTCAECGKRFTATKDHKYKVTSQAKGHDRMAVFCSYNCFRPTEKAMQEKFKAEALGFVNGYGRDKSPVERARARVEKCKKKLAELQAIRNDANAWAALSRKQKNNLSTTIPRWKTKLDEAEAALKEAETYEPG